MLFTIEDGAEFDRFCWRVFLPGAPLEREEARCPERFPDGREPARARDSPTRADKTDLPNRAPGIALLCAGQRVLAVFRRVVGAR